jgi:long-chain acyl-CoA synthetase
VQLRDTDRWMVFAPMFHASGTFQALLCAWFGIPQIIVPGFDAAQVLDTIDADGATITFGVPTMMRALADEQERRARAVTSLRLFGYGAAPASSTLLKHFHSRFPSVELVSMYGATELSPMATAVNHAERFVDDGQRARTAGRPLVGVDVRVVDERGDECPTGVIGEVVVRGPNVMAGYWDKPDATAKALRGGWYHTGDLGHFDDEGLLYLVDRLKDMIVTGGENVYSTEVEEVVARHPAVAECAVFAVPDDVWGEIVAVAVVSREAFEVGAADLQAHCRAGLAGYKVPRRVFVLEELPRTGAGKILKRELRAAFWEGRDRAIN